MKFQEVIGHDQIKSRLIRTVRENRISHAQMFLGPPGSGKLALAIAYAQYINCKEKNGKDSCGHCSSCVKFNKLSHPDLHFLYPTAKTRKIDKPVSIDFIKDWRELLLEQDYYFRLPEWYQKIGIERKQAIINARDCNNLIQTLGYKNYEADYKVMIIWMVEKLFHAAAPKILKFLEEPPAKTLFILVAEKTETILSTILSRTQIVKIPPIDDESLTNYLLGKNYDPQTVADAIRIYSGDYTEVRKFIEKSEEDNQFFDLFLSWMRSCYAGRMSEIVEFSGSIARNTREFQKSFLNYSLRMMRESFLINSGNEQLSRLKSSEQDFAKKFNPFIHKRNIVMISQELNEGVYHIERNVNSSVLFLDLSLKFTRLLKM